MSATDLERAVRLVLALDGGPTVHLDPKAREQLERALPITTDATPSTASPICCPSCGSDEQLSLSETYTAMHPAKARADGLLLVENALTTACPSEWFDEGAGDYDLHCWACGLTWDLPAGTPIAWDEDES